MQAKIALEECVVAAKAKFKVVVGLYSEAWEENQLLQAENKNMQSCNKMDCASVKG